MTTFLPDLLPVSSGVYAPQDDSLLLVDAIADSGAIAGRTVLDVCTGSGVVAIAAARLGAEQVGAVDVCRRAVRAARRNAAAAGVRVDVRRGDWITAMRRGRRDVVVVNPPYVPTPPAAEGNSVPNHVGPSLAWDAGPDGRQVLDPLCAAAADLLADGGDFFLVQSEFADPDASLRILGRSLRAEVVRKRVIPFGPVLRARAEWMERSGRLTPGRRDEEIVVIIARA